MYILANTFCTLVIVIIILPVVCRCNGPVCLPAINYTVVFPKSRRMVMFNTSADHVHAVTQILQESDRRYSLFCFLTTEEHFKG